MVCGMEVWCCMGYGVVCLVRFLCDEFHMMCLDEVWSVR